MMPSVEIEEGRGAFKVKRFVSLDQEWDEMHKMLNGKETTAMLAHKRELFGVSNFQHTDLFMDVQLGVVEGVPSYHVFQELSVRVQAKYLAYIRTSSMVKILERHYDVLDRNYRKMIKKTGKA